MSILQLLHNQRGSVATMSALAAPVLIGGLALGMEVGYWRTEQADLQAMVDAAAYAGAVGYAYYSDLDAAREAIEASLRLNGVNPADFVVSFPVEDDDQKVRVSSLRQAPRYFSRLFTDTDVQLVAASAVAGMQPASVSGCILALDEDGDGFRVIGNVDVDATGCSIFSNALSPNSISIGGSSFVIAECIATAQGANADSNHYQLNTCNSIEENAPPVEDPYADVFIPTAATAATVFPGSYVQHNNNYKTSRHRHDPIRSGIYETLTINSDAYFEDDAIVVITEKLDLKSNNSLVGTGVTIILVDGATIKATSQFRLELSAKTTGPYAGLIIAGDRTSNVETHRITGGAGSELTGAVYLPTGSLILRGGSESEVGCTHFIAYEIDMAGNSLMRNSCDNAGTRKIGDEAPRSVQFES